MKRTLPDGSELGARFKDNSERCRAVECHTPKSLICQGFNISRDPQGSRHQIMLQESGFTDTPQGGGQTDLGYHLVGEGTLSGGFGRDDRSGRTELAVYDLPNAFHYGELEASGGFLGDGIAIRFGGFGPHEPQCPCVMGAVGRGGDGGGGEGFGAGVVHLEPEGSRVLHLEGEAAVGAGGCRLIRRVRGCGEG